jgi:hypothetical protein
VLVLGKMWIWLGFGEGQMAVLGGSKCGLEHMASFSTLHVFVICQIRCRLRTLCHVKYRPVTPVLHSGKKGPPKLAKAIPLAES